MKTETSAPIISLLAILRQLQKIDPEFPIQYAICLGEIALNEGCSLTYLSDKTGLALSTVSRIVAALSSHRIKGNSYGFITIKISEEERRRKEIHLTPHGKEALALILSSLPHN